MSQITTQESVVVMGGVVELTGNSGGPVGPDGSGNINVVGDGVTVNVAGNPGTNTLTISTTGDSVLAYTNVTTTPYVVLATDSFLSVDSSTLAITVQLPNTTTTGRVIIIKDRLGNSFTNNITVTTVGGVVLIDGLASQTLNIDYNSIQVLWNGSSYETF